MRRQCPGSNDHQLSIINTVYAHDSSGKKMGVTFRFHLSRSAPYQIAGLGGKTGGEGRNRPNFPAAAPQIWLISLGIQAKTA